MLSTSISGKRRLREWRRFRDWLIGYCLHQDPEARRGEKMVRPERFELPAAFWFVAVAARRISSLAVFVRSEIRQHLCGFLTPLPFQIQG